VCRRSIAPSYGLEGGPGGPGVLETSEISLPDWSEQSEVDIVAQDEDARKELKCEEILILQSRR
jgi:hypothetical protein